MDLIRNNYLRGSGHGPTWNVEIDPPSRSVDSYFDETARAAEIVWEQKQGTLYLCYSGGLDSEYALSVFRYLGMEITPVIMRTAYNNHETKYAFDFCQANKITPLVVDLDYDKFVKSGKLLEIASSIECAAWQIPSNMWLCSQLDGTVITGDCPPHLKKKDGVWYLDEEEYSYSQLTYFKKYGVYGTPYFLNHTAEQMLSFLTDPTMQELANDRIPGKLGSNSSKVRVYNNNGRKFNLIQREKQHGYEFVEKADIYNHPDIQIVNSWKQKLYGSAIYQYHSLIETLTKGYTAIAELT